MSSQLEVPCLGRPFHLGMLYDHCTDKLIPGMTLWNKEKLTSAGLTTNQPACNIDISTDDTFHSKSSSFDIGGKLKLSLLCGMVDVKGAAKFLHDRKSSEKQSRVTLQYRSTSHFEQLTMEQLGEIQHPHVLDKGDATHVVTGITYGADAFLVFDRYVTEGEALDKVSNEMKTLINKIPFIGEVSAGSSLNFSKTEKTETSKFECKFYGDVIPETYPTTYDEALEFCKTLPTFLREEFKPKIAYMMPLSKLAANYQRLYHSIPLDITSQVEEIIEHLYHTKMRASDLMEESICNKFIDLRIELTNFKKLLDHFKRDFVEKLSQILPNIYSAGVKAEGFNLQKLLSSFEKSPFNPEETRNYLDGKDNEIKNLAQYLQKLKKRDKASRLQYDFPDTECSLSSLIDDNEIKHVVCFGFNVTSKTSPYIESLKAYPKTGKTLTIDDKEWFDNPEIASKLRTEIEKFLRYVEATSTTTEKMAYVVTSTNKKICNESGPSTLVFTDGVPMMLNFPGTPQATKVTIDSITLLWTAPKHVKVSSYKVLYCSKGESSYMPIKCRGLNCSIEGLSHGDEYEFRVQATSTSGFTVESDSAFISTTEYYDIAVIGKTGQGKSTLGNKLLDLKNTNESKIGLFDLRAAPDIKKWFVQADDPQVKQAGQQILSVTSRCKIMSNENSKIRVLDVPGFSDSGTLEDDVSVNEGNLQIIRWLVREQIQSQLKIRRIIYFLPVRGPLEKADGTLQEELQVLHRYFGKEVFNCLVAVATNHPREKYQGLEFKPDDFKQTEEAFHLALKKTTDDEAISCPPIIYVGLNDSPKKTLAKVQRASILKESILPLVFSEKVCGRCSYNIRYDDQNKEVCVFIKEGETIPYEESVCHPYFIPKYNNAEKVIGGIGHIATGGAALLVGHIFRVHTWPGFTNSDEKCVSCEKYPGSIGCAKVGESIMIKKNGKQETVKVSHSNRL